MTKRGVYFIANNRVADLTIAFLKSFRRFNPETNLCLIPYNYEMSDILILKTQFNFVVFDESSLLVHCDEISRRFHPRTNGAYRKLAMWNGIYDEFIYIDVDTLVLNDLAFVFEQLKEYDCLTSHSNIPSIRKFVWKKSIYQKSLLTSEQIDFAANTGFIASKKGFLDIAGMLLKIPDAESLKAHMELKSQEQPLLNYLIVTSGKPYSSLRVLHYFREKEGIMHELWAGTREGRMKDGKIYSKHRKIFLIHWAGLWQPKSFDFILNKILKTLRIVSAEHQPMLRFFMPRKKIWKYYKTLGD